jgi:hypothetical protein
VVPAVPAAPAETLDVVAGAELPGAVEGAEVVVLGADVTLTDVDGGVDADGGGADVAVVRAALLGVGADVGAVLALLGV